MQISNKLKNLIFYFLFVFGLIGCNGLTKSRLECLAPKQYPDRNQDFQESITSQPSTQQKVATIDLPDNGTPHFITALCKKGYLATFDKAITNSLASCLSYLLGLDVNNTFCCSNSIHQKMGDYIWSGAGTVAMALLKKKTKTLREFLYKYFSNVHFRNRVTTSFEPTSNACDRRSSAAMNHFSFMEWLDLCRQTCLATLDGYNAKFIEHLLIDFFYLKGGMPSMPSSISDYDDYMPQLIVMVMWHIAHPVVKALIKQQVVQVRQSVIAYCSDPEFINCVPPMFNVIGNALYTGAVNSA